MSLTMLLAGGAASNRGISGVSAFGGSATIGMGANDDNAMERVRMDHNLSR